MDSAARYRYKPGSFSSHGRILQFLQPVPRDARILDVGTATGYFGAVLRRQGFSRVSGVEVNPAWAEEARPWYERLVVADVQSAPLPWPPGSFDVIMCADVLEHVSNPLAALLKLRPLLSPSGWLLASLPNVAHWSIRLSLLFGHFAYRDNGILDRDHLRFFTRQSARSLLRQASLVAARHAVTPLPASQWSQGSGWAWPGLAWERVEYLLARLRPTVFGYQFVFFCQGAA